MSTELTGAEIVFKALTDHKVEYIFGYPGGAVLPLYDQLSKQKKINIYLVRHEQGAGHAAEGYARSHWKTGSSFSYFRTWCYQYGYSINRCVYGFYSS